MSIANILTLINAAVSPPYSALFLYGSYARGDQTSSSDIDILQVTPTHTAPYSTGLISVTCYTPTQILDLANNGSLFVRHLVSEAVPLEDPHDFFRLLQRSYSPPSNYDHIHREIAAAIPIIFIDEDEYNNNTRHYAATASYLMRTHVYASAFEQGAKSFAMRHVSEVIEDLRPYEYLRELRSNRDYRTFSKVVKLLCDRTGVPIDYRRESLEAFVVNAYGRSELAVILGLRVIARGDLVTYLFIGSRRA